MMKQIIIAFGVFFVSTLANAYDVFVSPTTKAYAEADVVDSHGSFILVGAHLDSPVGNSSPSGKAYMIQRVDGVFVQEYNLFGSSYIHPGAAPFFGAGVAVNDNWLAVAASGYIKRPDTQLVVQGAIFFAERAGSYSVPSNLDTIDFVQAGGVERTLFLNDYNLTVVNAETMPIQLNDDWLFVGGVKNTQGTGVVAAFKFEGNTWVHKQNIPSSGAFASTSNLLMVSLNGALESYVLNGAWTKAQTLSTANGLPFSCCYDLAVSGFDMSYSNGVVVGSNNGSGVFVVKALSNGQLTLLQTFGNQKVGSVAVETYGAGGAQIVYGVFQDVSGSFYVDSIRGIDMAVDANLLLHGGLVYSNNIFEYFGESRRSKQGLDIVNGDVSIASPGIDGAGGLLDVGGVYIYHFNHEVLINPVPNF